MQFAELVAVLEEQLIVIRHGGAIRAEDAMLVSITTPMADTVPLLHIVLSQALCVGEHITSTALIISHMHHDDMISLTISFDIKATTIDACAGVVPHGFSSHCNMFMEDRYYSHYLYHVV